METAVLVFSAFAAPAPDFSAFAPPEPSATLQKVDPHQPAPVGYEWVRREGEDWKLVRLAAPGVTAPRTFPGFHAGHSCPACGRSEFTIAGYNADGTHSHRCRFDGTVWRH